MKITSKNIRELSVGKTIWIADSFKIPETLCYIGIINGYHGFFSITGTISIFEANPDSNIDLKYGRIFTTYEEACEKMRELCIQTIEHFNKHQLKNNKIIVVQ